MYDIEHAAGTNEAANENAVFDACRANEAREPRGNVTFMLLASGDHQAALRDADGVVVTLCKVDKFDC